LWIAFLLWDYAQDDRLSELQSASVLILASAGTAMFFAALRDRDCFGFGAQTNWGTTVALIAGFTVQLPLDRYEGWSNRQLEIDSSDRWAEISGVWGADYWILAGGFAALLAAGLAWRFLRTPASRTLAIPAAAAGAFAFLLPSLAGLLGGEAILLLRILVGIVIFAVAIALILYGSREGRRFTGGMGIALFVAQTLYVYGETFGDLLDTSLFFLIGGLLLFGLSMTVIRVQKRLSRDTGASS
jgi:hypothetical protein